MLAASHIIIIRDLVETLVERRERGAASLAVSQSLITSLLVSPVYGTMVISGWQEIMR